MVFTLHFSASWFFKFFLWFLVHTSTPHGFSGFSHHYHAFFSVYLDKVMMYLLRWGVMVKNWLHPQQFVNTIALWFPISTIFSCIIFITAPVFKKKTFYNGEKIKILDF